MELVEEIKLQPVENALFIDAIVGIKVLTCIILYNIRYNFLDVNRNILVQIRNNKTSWVAANYTGFRPFNAFGFTRALEIWDRISLESLKCWERVCCRTPIFCLLWQK